MDEPPRTTPPTFRLNSEIHLAWTVGSTPPPEKYEQDQKLKAKALLKSIFLSSLLTGNIGTTAGQEQLQTAALAGSSAVGRLQ